MATPDYPTTLPGVSQWRLKPTAQVLASAEGSARATRRRSRVPGAIGEAQWTFVETDYAAFRTWWTTDLLRGHKKFWIELPSAGGITWHLCQFTGPYRMQSQGYGAFAVTAELEVMERQLTPNLRDEAYFFLEDFESGFGAYSIVSGSLSPFSIGPGMTGNCMHASPYISGSQAIIQRTLDAPVTCNFLSVRFRVTTLGSDDALILTLRDGTTEKLALVPIREGFYDSFRRVQLSMNGSGLQPASFGIITLNRIYRLEVTFNAGVAATAAVLIDEEGESTVKTTMYTAPPFQFDSIRFILDPAAGTCETDYDDIYVL